MPWEPRSEVGRWHACHTCGLNFYALYKRRRKYCSKKCSDNRTVERNEEVEIARFWSKVRRKTNDQCWEWIPNKSQRYGNMRFFKHRIAAHRLSWEIHNGKIQEGLLICHRCDNARCVNPLHLFIGTQADNMEDRNRKGRFGKHLGNRKLSPLQVEEIRSLYRVGDLTQQELASRYGVRQTNISEIIRGSTWKELSFPSPPLYRGENVRHSRLTEQKVKEAIELRNLGWSLPKLSRLLGASTGTIDAAVKGHTWKWVKRCF